MCSLKSRLNYLCTRGNQKRYDPTKRAMVTKTAELQSSLAITIRTTVHGHVQPAPNVSVCFCLFAVMRALYHVEINIGQGKAGVWLPTVSPNTREIATWLLWWQALDETGLPIGMRLVRCKHKFQLRICSWFHGLQIGSSLQQQDSVYCLWMALVSVETNSLSPRSQEFCHSVTYELANCSWAVLGRLRGSLLSVS